MHNSGVLSFSFPFTDSCKHVEWGKKSSRPLSKTQTLMTHCKLSKCTTSFGEWSGLAQFLKQKDTWVCFLYGTLEVATSEVHFSGFLFLLSTDKEEPSVSTLLSSKSKLSDWTALNYHCSWTANDSGSLAFEKEGGGNSSSSSEITLQKSSLLSRNPHSFYCTSSYH